MYGYKYLSDLFLFSSPMLKISSSSSVTMSRELMTAPPVLRGCRATITNTASVTYSSSKQNIGYYALGVN